MLHIMINKQVLIALLDFFPLGCGSVISLFLSSLRCMVGTYHTPTGSMILLCIVRVIFA